MFIIENNIQRFGKRGEGMIRGIGIDIIEIERIRRAVERHSGFVDRFLPLRRRPITGNGV